MNEWIAKLLDHPDMRRMGHGQRQSDLNLGLGWIYYGLGRVIRPSTAVVIGSFRGFVPLILGKAMQDNLEQGVVHFIDPSLVDDFWKDPHAVQAHLAEFDVTNVRHHLMTTQQYVESEPYRALTNVDLLFIDGYHSEEQARFDFDAFQRLLTPGAITLFHDSIRIESSKVYGPDRAYECRVKYFVDALKKDAQWQVFDLPFAQGVTLVRRPS